MNEERTGKCLRQMEHIHSHLWHWYSITVLKPSHGGDRKLSRWLLQLKGNMNLVIVFFFFLRWKFIYLQNMSIKRRLARFDPQTNVYFRCFCVQLVSQHHILYMSQFPNYIRNGTSAWVWTLKISFNSIQRSWWWPMLILELL